MLSEVWSRRGDAGILFVRSWIGALTGGLFRTWRRQAARFSAAPGLGAALSREDSREVQGTSVRGAALSVGLSGLLGPGRGVLAEPDRTERSGGRAGRSSYWPGAGRRVMLRGVLLPLAPAGSFSLSRTSPTSVLARHGRSR